MAQEIWENTWRNMLKEKQKQNKNKKNADLFLHGTVSRDLF